MAKRRANGEGSLRQRKTGSWELTVMVGFDKITGKKICKSFSGKTQKEVRAKFEQYKAEISKGIDVNSDYNFGEWADIWYDNHKDNAEDHKEPFTEFLIGQYDLNGFLGDNGNCRSCHQRPPAFPNRAAL